MNNDRQIFETVRDRGRGDVTIDQLAALVRMVKTGKLVYRDSD